MTYAAYLRFYGLEATAETREDWLHSLWSKGAVYKYGDKFFSTTTGKEVR